MAGNPFLEAAAAREKAQAPARPGVPATPGKKPLSGNPFLDAAAEREAVSKQTPQGSDPTTLGKSCPPGMDCSQFSQHVLKGMGAKIPRTAVQQYMATDTVGHRDKLDTSKLKVGDLVFFDNKIRDAYNTEGKKVGDGYVNHVGVYVGNGKFVHDPGNKSDNRREVDLAQYVKSGKVRFMGAGRAKELRDAQPQPTAPKVDRKALVDQRYKYLVSQWNKPINPLGDNAFGRSSREPLTTETSKMLRKRAEADVKQVHTPDTGPQIRSAREGVEKKGLETRFKATQKFERENPDEASIQAYQIQGMTRDQAELAHAKAKGSGAEAAYRANKLVKDVGKFVAPVVRPAVTAGVTSTLGPGLGTKAGEIAPDLVGGVVSLPVQFGASVMIAADDNSTPLQKLGATAEILSYMVPAEELVLKGLFKVAKGTGKIIVQTGEKAAKGLDDILLKMTNTSPEAADAAIAVRQALKSGIKAEDVLTQLSTKVDVPKGLEIKPGGAVAKGEIPTTGKGFTDPKFSPNAPAKSTGNPFLEAAAAREAGTTPPKFDTTTTPPKPKEIPSEKPQATSKATKTGQEPIPGNVQKAEEKGQVDIDAEIARLKAERKARIAGSTVEPPAAKTAKPAEAPIVEPAGKGGTNKPPPKELPTTAKGSEGSGPLVKDDATIDPRDRSLNPMVSNLEFAENPGVAKHWKPFMDEYEKALSKYYDDIKAGKKSEFPHADEWARSKGLSEKESEAFSDFRGGVLALETRGDRIRAASIADEGTKQFVPSAGVTSGPLPEESWRAALKRFAAKENETRLFRSDDTNDKANRLFSEFMHEAFKHDTRFSMSVEVWDDLLDPKIPEGRKYFDQFVALADDLGLTTKRVLGGSRGVEPMANALPQPTKSPTPPPKQQEVAAAPTTPKVEAPTPVAKQPLTPKPADVKAVAPAKAKTEKLEAVNAKIETLKAQRDARLAKTTKPRTKQSGAVDITAEDLIDAAKLTSLYVQKAGLTAQQWAKEMIEEFGDAVKPHLKKLWDDHAGDARKGEFDDLAKSETKKPTFDLPDRKGTAIANDETNIIRRRIGEPEYLGTDPETVKEWAKEAMARGLHEPAKAYGHALKVLDGTEKSLGKVESIGLASALDNLDSQWDDLNKQLLAKVDEGGDLEIAKQLDDVSQQMTTIVKAANASGAEWGRTGVARQAMMKADTSFGGMIVRRQKLVDRDLTTAEITSLKAQVEEGNAIRAEQANRIAELEAAANKKAAQETISGYSGGGKPSADKIAKIDARIKDVGERLKAKWAENKPQGLAKSSLFGADILAEQIVRVGKIAPEILELSKLHWDKGITVLADHVGAITKSLKEFGIDDVSENDVAAVIGGRIRAEGQPVTPTAYQAMKAEATTAFREAAEDRAKRAAFVAQRDREIKQNANRAQKQSDLALLKRESDALANEERLAKQAEKAFWKDVADQERAFKKGEKKAASLDRKESIARWKASIQGKRAQGLNRLERLGEKLEFFNKEGQILGQKSKIPEKPDAILNEINIKEAAWRNRMDKIEKEMKTRAEFDALSPAMQFVKKWSPWNVSRSVVASFDNSFGMNQGALTLFSDPKSWGKGFKKSFESVSEKGYDRVMAEIRADLPNYERAEAAGLFEGVANMQDIFGLDTISRAPGIKQSQQMYDGGANAMRFDMFNRWVDMAEAGGKPLDVEGLRTLAKEVKTWTGQGDWLKGQTAISKPFFALRYRMSQFEVLMGAPLARTFSYGTKSKNWKPFKVMLAKYSQAAATIVGTVAVANEALKRLGPKNPDGSPQWYIDLEPTSTNWGRLVHKVGRTTQSWDVLPPPVRLYGLGAKVVQGKKITMGGTVLESSDFKGQGLRTKLVGEYITNGAHPVPRALWAYLEGQDADDKKYYGKSQDFSKTGAYVDLGLGFGPISTQSWKEIWENGDLSVTEKILGSGLVPFVSSNVTENEHMKDPLGRPWKKGMEASKVVIEMNRLGMVAPVKKAKDGETKEARDKRQMEFANKIAPLIEKAISSPDYAKLPIDVKRNRIEIQIQKWSPQYKFKYKPKNPETKEPERELAAK